MTYFGALYVNIRIATFTCISMLIEQLAYSTYVLRVPAGALLGTFDIVVDEA